jgi:hypothetical protein
LADKYLQRIKRGRVKATQLQKYFTPRWPLIGSVD